MARLFAGLMAALVAGTAAAMAQTKAPPVAPATRAGERLAALARLPEWIGGLAQSGPPRLNTARGVSDGAMARYQGTLGFMSVFLYRMAGAPPVPAGPDAPAVQTELADAEHAMLGTMREAGPDGVERAPPEMIVAYALAAEGGGLAFRCVEARRTLRPGEPGHGAVRHEHVCVTGLQEGFLKLRVTLQLRVQTAMIPRREVERLVGAVGLALARP